MMFSNLNMDVTLLVLEYIAWKCPASLKSVSLVNKALNGATQTLKHRTKRVTLAQINADEEVIRNTEQVTKWLSDENVLRGLRCLTIETSPGTAYPQATSTEIAHLARLLTKVGRLRHLHWSARVAMPLEILDALHKYQPKAELRMLWFRATEGLGHDDKAELELAHSPNLTYLFANGQPAYSLGRDDTFSGALHQIIASAPRLTTVVLTNSAWRCCEMCYGKRYPEHAQELSKKNSGFYEGLGRSTSIRKLTAFGDLDDFLNAYEQLMDLGKLRNVIFRHARMHTPTFFLRAPALMPSVKHLVLQMHVRKELLEPQIQEAIDESLMRYLTVTGPPLQGLDLTVKPRLLSVLGIMTNHGSTLRSFGLHYRERNRGPPRQSLDVEDALVLKRAAQKLTSLSFDIQRRSESLTADLEYYKPLFEAVAQLGLKSLSIHMDVGLELQDYPEIKNVHENAVDMPALHYLPPANTRKWGTRWKDPYVPENFETDIKRFVESVWSIVFGCMSSRGGRKLEVHFEEWDYWWRISRGRRVNVKEDNCVRSVWIAEESQKDEEEVEAKHVSTWHGRGMEYRVDHSKEFIG